MKHKYLKKILGGPAFSFLIVSVVIAQPNNWEPRGIGGGGALFSPSISPHDENEVFIACDMTDLFHTKTLGQNWEVIPFQEFRAYPESRINFTSDSNILYAVHNDFKTDLRFPARSTDGGSTWTPLANDPTFGESYYLHADPGSINRLIVSNYDQIFFSNDGGASFSTIYSNNENEGAYIGGAFWDGDNIYIAVAPGLLVSSNGGASFILNAFSGIPNSEGIISFFGAKQGNITRFYCVTLNLGDIYPTVTGAEHWGFQGVYTLDLDGSPAWIKKTSGISSNDHPYFVTGSPINIDVAYLGGGNGETSYPIVFITTDGGATWNEVFLTTNNQNIQTGWSGYRGDEDWWYGEYVLGLAVAPTNPDIVLYTDLGFVHVSTDGGTSWQQRYVDSNDENSANAATPKGLSYRSVGLENTSCWWMTWINQNEIFVPFTDVTAIRSTDGGSFWSRNYNNLDYNSVYHSLVHPVNGVLYAATSTIHDIYQSTYLQDEDIDDGDGAVMYSTDSGLNWQTLHDFGAPVVWLALDPSDNNTLYASVAHSSDGGIYRTQDLQDGASSSWSRLSEPPRTHGHPLNIYVLKDGTLLASYSGWRDSNGSFTNSSGIFVSEDNGNTWVDRSDSGMLYWTKDVVVDPHDAQQNTWYAGVFSGWGGAPNGLGGLYRTTNRGLYWKKINDLDRVESCTVHPQNPNILYLTAEADGLWVTQNLNDSSPLFSLVSSYPFQHPMRVFINPFYGNQVWITSFGNGLRLGNETTTSVQTASSQPDDFQISISPNPATTETATHLVLSRPSNVEIKLFNVLGQQVQVILSPRMMQDGQHDFVAVLENLPTGLYLMTARVGQRFVTRKLTIMK